MKVRGDEDNTQISRRQERDRYSSEYAHCCIGLYMTVTRMRAQFLNGQATEHYWKKERVLAHATHHLEQHEERRREKRLCGCPGKEPKILPAEQRLPSSHLIATSDSTHSHHPNVNTPPPFISDNRSPSSRVHCLHNPVR